jgi:DNA polymerase delta subunit 1
MRDNYTAMMDAVFEKKDQNQAKSILLNVINDIVNDKVPLEKYVISKSLKLSYSYEQGPDPETGKVPPPPHQAAVRDKMRERAPGKEPKSGDRVPFVMTWTGKEDDKKWKMAEDPNYVRDSNGKIKINRLYYLEFVKPIFSEFMEPMFEGVDKVFDNAIEMVRSQMKGLVSLANFFGPQSVLGKKRTREDDKQRIDTLAMDESDDNGSASDQPKAKRAALNDETREH